MSQETADGQGSVRRSVQLKWVIIALIVAAVVVAVILVSLLLVDRQHDSERRAVDEAAAAVTEVTSPYDFSELPAESDPGDVESASFISILLADDSGQLTSYGIDSDLPAAQALSEAIRTADEVDAAALATSTTVSDTSSGADAAAVSTVTFVFPDRGTLTFDLYLDPGLIARGDRVWRVDGDLKALVAAAVAAGQQ